MDNEQMTVPYIVFEGSMARSERHIKRLIIALIVAVVMIAATNIAWLYVWNSYEYAGTTSDITVDSDRGIANYIGNDGEISYGENPSEEGDEISQEKER